MEHVLHANIQEHGILILMCVFLVHVKPINFGILIQIVALIAQIMPLCGTVFNVLAAHREVSSLKIDIHV